MKNLFLIAIACLMTLSTVQAQKVKVGLRLGVQGETQDYNNLSISDMDTTSFGLNLADKKIGYHGGLWVRFGEKIYFQPEIVFNNSTTEYSLSTTTMNSLLKEKYNYLDIPLLVGASVGPFRLYGGPVGHVFLNSTSDLIDVAGYSENFDKMNWGWQAGLGIGKGRFSVDFRYEGNNFKNDHLTFFGTQYEASKSPARFIATVGIGLN